MLNQKMRALGSCRSVIRELFEYGKKRKSEIGQENVFDFSLGNPSLPPPSELTKRLVGLIETESPMSLHGYTSSEGDRAVREKIAKKINSQYEESITPDCIFMTMGAAGALASAIRALTNEGDEVICLTPYFPEYRVFIESAGAAVREVPTREKTFTPDLDKISEAINEKTAMIIINSPNNPTGAVYGESEISALANLLYAAEKKYKHPIYLISDEPYRELFYTEDEPPYITKYYNDTLVCYSYSKSFSLPGERIGYALICPRMTDFTAVKEALMGAARALGHVCAPSLLQKLIGASCDLTANIDGYRKNGERLYTALTEMGYEACEGKGAFYLFVKALEDDAREFCEAAKKFELLLVPSDSFGVGGYVRIAYCVESEMIERSLPAFKSLMEYYKKDK